MDHAQIGLLLRFNSKFETSIPAPFIWKSPPASKAHFVAFLSRRCQNVANVHETFINTKIPF